MFHGTTAATTPTGCFDDPNVLAVQPRTLLLPFVASGAKPQNADIIISGSRTCAILAKLIGAPISAEISSAMSARRSL